MNEATKEIMMGKRKERITERRQVMNIIKCEKINKEKREMNK